MNRRSLIRSVPLAEPLERRSLLAIDTVVAQTYLDPNSDLIAQSAAGSSNGSGTSVVVYSDRNSTTSLGNEVYVRRFNAASSPLEDASVVNTTTADSQMNPDVAMNASGAFVVVWQSRNQDGSGWGVYARAYDATGAATTGEVLVNQTTSGNQVSPRVAIGSDGTFVVAWTNADTGNGEIYARRFASSGVALGGAFTASGATTDAYGSADVALLPSGEFAIAWTRTLRGGDNSADVQMRFYDAAGSGVGATILPELETDADQAEPALGVAGGHFLVAWTDDSSGSAQVMYRAFSTAASPLNSPVQANQDSDGTRSRPKIAGDAAGNFTVGWTRQESGAFYSGTDFRSFDLNFDPTSNETTISDGTSARTLFDVVPTGTGTFRDVSTINEFVGYGVPVSTSLQNVLEIDGTADADTLVIAEPDSATIRATLNGTANDYVRSAYVSGLRINLAAGNDVVDASASTSNVTLDGGAGDDSILTGVGNDCIVAGDGADTVNSGAGSDTIDGGAGNDSLAGKAGNDSILGGDGDDTIDCGTGDDYSLGGDGNDLINGGDGRDTLSTGAGRNILYGGFGEDRLNGSGGRDTLLGEDDSDRLYGNGGDDSIDGGGGVDRLWGGDGNDYLVGGSSNDRIWGEAGNDTLGGGKGNDYLDGGDDTDTVLGREPGDTLISIEVFK